MASSSSSIHKSYQYDVFLSFRGEDTRKNFVDHLYEALHQQGIRTFKDDVRLEKGKRINNELLKSIDESKLCIIIFSNNYASSSWCLDELVKIMESHKDTAYLVFYDVDPSEVRKQSGAVRETFSRHANEEGAPKWREALREAANLSGWNVREIADGHEAQVVKLIGESVSLELRSFNMDIDENLVGMERRMQDLDSCLEIGNSDDVRRIGIKGMGGAGKTTLARAIFNRFSIRFEAKSFVENVREVSTASLSGLMSLQEKILSDLLKDLLKVSSVHDGKRMMKMRLCSTKVILVLDDVDETEQLEALAGAPDWFKPGSRIIITTRNEEVLTANKVELIRDVTLLSNEEAIRLFSRHAFGREIPRSEYEKESLEAVRYAAGLPLTIRVLGSSLCGKNKLEWTDALQRLKKIPLNKTLEKLELSYESLEDDYKDMFLDVTCFMKGWNIENAIKTLEKSGFNGRIGLTVLKQRSLITMKRYGGSLDYINMHYHIEELGKNRYGGSLDYINMHDRKEELGKNRYGGSLDYINMHDHIEELGKNIVRRLHLDEPHEHSRLWIQEEIEDVLANDMGTEATRCVQLKLTPEIDLTGLGNMKTLEWLLMENLHKNENIGDHVMIDEVNQYFPNSLRYLSWKSYPYWCLPKTFRASNLVGLQMPKGRIEQLWPHGDRKVMKKLTDLDLSDSKIRKLDLGMMPNLERLNLYNCKDLEEVDVPDGCLERLFYLNLNGCKRVKSLLFIKHLKSIEILRLSYLSLSLSPDIIPTHSNSTLLELHFSENNIKELPSSIGNLHKLVYLDLSYCKKLPQSLCSLPHLQTLDLSRSGIEELPEDLGQLKSLVVLKLSYCDLIDIPSSICMLKHLQVSEA